MSWHFPAETVAFLADLRDNNNRDWFNENKSRYQRAFRHQAEAFVDPMTAALTDLTGVAHKSKIFRIYRDVRFSKDKTPYNAHLHISFLPTDPAAPSAWFFGLDPDGLVLGAGIFAFEKAALIRYRDRVAGIDGEELVEIIDTLTRRGMHLGAPELKRVPTGYPAEHPRADLLRRKGMAVWHDFKDTKSATRGDLVATCGKTFATLKPLCDWLNEV